MAIDIDSSFYRTGTATVAANGTTVTGQGTSWKTALRAGDMFGTHVGDGVRILSVNSNTSLTLAWPWKGPAQTATGYEVQLTLQAIGYQKAVRELLQLLTNGNLESLASVVGEVNTMPYFTGIATFEKTPLTPFARTLLATANGSAAYAALGVVPDAQISSTLPQDKAYRRGNILGNVSQSGGVPTGAVIQRGSNANGEFVRFADGTQICWILQDSTRRIPITEVEGSGFRGQVTWNFPSVFAFNPVFYGGLNDYRGGSLANAGKTTTFVEVVAQSTIRINESGGAQWNAAAIGRWF